MKTLQKVFMGNVVLDIRQNQNLGLYNNQEHFWEKTF